MRDKIPFKKVSDQPLLFIVEDCPAYRFLLGCVLEKKGFEVMKFEKPEDAIQMLRFYTPAVFISDIEMPVMNGFDLQAAISMKFPSLKIPFIYISSTTSEENIRRASEMGAIEMLGKPISKDLLFSSLHKVLNGQAA